MKSVALTFQIGLVSNTLVAGFVGYQSRDGGIVLLYRGNWYGYDASEISWIEWKEGTVLSPDKWKLLTQIQGAKKPYWKEVLHELKFRTQRSRKRR